MKTKYYKFILPILILAWVGYFAIEVIAYQNGISGQSTAASDGCYCHDSNPSTSTSLTLTSGSLTVEPGSTTTYTIAVANSNQSRAGINIAVTTSASGTTSVGSLSPTLGSGLQTMSDELTHTSPKELDNGEVEFSFTWTAPLTPGTYYMKAAGNAVNYDGTNSNDAWNFMAVKTIVVQNATQNIALTSGWNMISSYVVPQSTSMASIGTSLIGKAQQVKNAYGQIYSPPFQNSLNTWNKLHAYQIRMNVASNFPISGISIRPDSLPIVLNQLGWYWLPYFRKTNMPPATALASISGKYLQIKNIQGKVYQPPFTSTLTELEPGMGYMIRMIAVNGTLTYPANTATKASTNDYLIREPQVFVRDKNITGKTSFIALDLSNIENGDEIGVFTRDGLLVGSSVWSFDNHGVVVWGDDEYTVPKDGAYEGEELILKIWSNSANSIGKASQISLNDMTNSKISFSLAYETDGIHLLKGKAEIQKSSIYVSPQPASNEIFVRTNILTDNDVDIKIYNQQGKLALETKATSNSGGFKVATNSLPSGVYQLILNLEGKTYSEKVVVVR